LHESAGLFCLNQARTRPESGEDKKDRECAKRMKGFFF